MLLCAVVPSLIHDYICRVARIAQCTQLIENAGCKPLKHLKGYPSHTRLPGTMMEDQPPVLLFSRKTHTHTHICSHARLLPAIIVQIWVVLAHIPEPTPLLRLSLLHCCVVTGGSATESTAPAQANCTLGFQVFILVRVKDLYKNLSDSQGERSD